MLLLISFWKKAVSNLKKFFLRYNAPTFFNFKITTFCCLYLLCRDYIFAIMKSDSLIKEKILEIRRRKGISQEKMAIMLGITTYSFRKLERGPTVIINCRLWDVAKILEVTLEELMLDEDFESGKSLADVEREKFLAEIEALKGEIEKLKQNLNLMTGIYNNYVKRAK